MLLTDKKIEDKSLFCLQKLKNRTVTLFCFHCRCVSKQGFHNLTRYYSVQVKLWGILANWSIYLLILVLVQPRTSFHICTVCTIVTILLLLLRSNDQYIWSLSPLVFPFKSFNSIWMSLDPFNYLKNNLTPFLNLRSNPSTTRKGNWVIFYFQ